jgi:hypothetical protein
MQEAAVGESTNNANDEGRNKRQRLQKMMETEKNDACDVVFACGVL